jgi:hypothetical protein
MALPANRNRVGTLTMAWYVIGLLCLGIGIYVSAITRLYLYTGQETHPYLNVGVPLAVIGIALVACAQVVAKRSLRK